MREKTKLPADLQKTCDEVVAAFHAGREFKEGIEKIQAWLEDEGWDDLIADLGEQMVINLGYLSQCQFCDSELRPEMDIPDDVPVTDRDRIQWGREKIDDALTGDDEYLLPSLHTYTLEASDGSSSVIGCLVEVHGQSGPVCDWQGLWKSREDFLDSFRGDIYSWVTPLMGDVPDDVILSLWQKDSHIELE